MESRNRKLDHVDSQQSYEADSDTFARHNILCESNGLWKLPDDFPKVLIGTDSVRHRFGKTDNEGLKPISVVPKNFQHFSKTENRKVFSKTENRKIFQENRIPKTEKFSAKTKTEKFSAKPKTEKF